MTTCDCFQVLTPLLRSCSGDEDEDAASVFVPSCTPSGGFQEVQCRGAECWCVDAQGQEVAGSRTAGGRPRCPSRCERERAAALKVKGNMAAGAEIHVPACSEDGEFLSLQCVGARCFCVDAEGKTTGPTGGAVTCKISHWQTRLHVVKFMELQGTSQTLFGPVVPNLGTWRGKRVGNFPKKFGLGEFLILGKKTQNNGRSILFKSWSSLFIICTTTENENLKSHLICLKNKDHIRKTIKKLK